MSMVRDPLFSDWRLLFDTGEVAVFLTGALGLTAPNEPSDWQDFSQRTRYHHARKALFEAIDKGLRGLRAGHGWPELAGRLAALADPPPWVSPLLERLENNEPAQPPKWQELLERLRTSDRLLSQLHFLVARHCHGLDRQNLVDSLVAEVYDFVRRNAAHWYRIRGTGPDNSWWGWLKCDLPTRVKRRCAAARDDPPEDRAVDPPAPVAPPAGTPGPAVAPAGGRSPSRTARRKTVSIHRLPVLADHATPEPGAELEVVELLEKLAAGLSAEELRIVIGRGMERLSAARLAAELQWPVERVRSEWRRLRGKVRRILLSAAPGDYDGWGQK
jgi:hypothetical protein